MGGRLDLTEAAGRILEAASKGLLNREDAKTLAREWLAFSGGDLAIAVLKGKDEFLAARAIELAAHIFEGGR